MIDKKKLFLFYFLCSFILVYAEDNYSTNFKTQTINKKESENIIIEKEVFGKYEGITTLGLSRL